VVRGRAARLTVLHVAHTGEGGVGKCVGDLARDQLGRGWRVVVATRQGSDLAEEAAAAGAVTAPWTATRHPTPRLAQETLQLREIVREADPDVVHVHSSKAGLCGRLTIRGRLPTLFQPHGWSFEAAHGVLEHAVVGWERVGARWAHAIVCVSEAERDRGLARGIRARYRVIPNGVDVTRYGRKSEADRNESRRRLGLGPQPLVVCVGRLSRAKGQDVLLDSWPAVRRRVPQSELALVGDGEDMDELRRRADPSIRLLGHRADVVDWLAASDVVAVPSRWEGMSLGMLEAMATGRSIVATDVPGAREAVDGTGAIVPPEDPEALAAAIAARLLDPRRREAEGRAAADRARQNHDLREILERVAELSAEVARAQLPRLLCSTPRDEPASPL
jgi:glycosyltransferase involved in cell wall biosynthesis